MVVTSVLVATKVVLLVAAIKVLQVVLLSIEWIECFISWVTLSIEAVILVAV